MATHAKHIIDKLTAELDVRHDKLKAALDGSEPIYAHDSLKPKHYAERSIKSEDIRIAVDDFQNILKEIKATLGKRR
jgi:hypothetical protein